MAFVKSLYNCTVLLLLLLSGVAPHVHGRRLWRRQNGCKRSCPVQNGQARDDAEFVARRTVLQLVDDSQAYRPTTPGHSPGVGHLLEGKASRKDAGSAPARTPSVGTQDPRPSTFLGGVTGVGHSNNVVIDNMLSADMQDLRPTTPGHSPGVGHTFEDKRKENTVDGGLQSTGKGSPVGAADDLRPTDPGHSPGVGHSFEYKLN